MTKRLDHHRLLVLSVLVLAGAPLVGQATLQAQTLPPAEPVVALTGSCIDEPGACSFELRDLSGDGTPELLVTAESDALYVFAVIGGAWAPVANMPLYASSTWSVLDSRSNGWNDVQLRVNDVDCVEDTAYHWSGSAYVEGEHRVSELTPGACGAPEGGGGEAPEAPYQGFLLDHGIWREPARPGGSAGAPPEWTLLRTQGGPLSLDVSAVEALARANVNAPVTLAGTERDGRLVVGTLAPHAPFTFSVEGTLMEPETGFDSRALSWHVVTDEGARIELAGFDDDDLLTSLAGQRVRASGHLALGSRFFEDRGGQVAIDHVTESLTPVGPGPVSRPSEGECVCPAVWEPVCGTDGMTYSNSCQLACAGVGFGSPGQCEGDSAAAAPAPGPIGTLADQTLAGLEPGSSADQVRAALGEPSAREGDGQVEGATGCRVETWSYPAQGLSLDLCFLADDAAAGGSVRRIAAQAPWNGVMPCGLGIGTDEATVRAVLGGDLNYQDYDSWRGLRVDLDEAGQASLVVLYELAE